MITIPTYQCEICQTRYDDQEEALLCEESPLPIIPEWFLNRLGKTIYGFGENGIEVSILDGFSLEAPSIISAPLDNFLRFHKLMCRLHYMKPISLNHNWSDGNRYELSALDPMHGYDFFRYLRPGDREFESTIFRWQEICLEYGLEPDATKTIWFRGRTEEFQQAVLDILT